MTRELTVLQDTRRFADALDQSVCNGCDECGARCVADVPILESEFLAIQAYRTGPEGAGVREVEAQEKRLSYPGTTEVYYTACRFRDSERGRCSIYPVRPLVCRLFGYVEWLPCPIAKTSGAAPGGVEIMRRYGEAPLKSWEEWFAESNPEPGNS